jgi:hypothetical protein
MQQDSSSSSNQLFHSTTSSLSVFLHAFSGFMGADASHLSHKAAQRHGNKAIAQGITTCTPTG